MSTVTRPRSTGRSHRLLVCGGVAVNAETNDNEPGSDDGAGQRAEHRCRVHDAAPRVKRRVSNPTSARRSRRRSDTVPVGRSWPSFVRANTAFVRILEPS